MTGPALPLALFALAIGGLRNPWALGAASVFLWGAVAAAPEGLRRLPGARLWIAWLLWSAVSAALSAEPLRGLAALSLRASAFGLLTLAASAEDGPTQWVRAVLGAALAIEAASWLVAVPGFDFVGVLYPYYNYTGAVASVATVLGFGFLLGRSKKDRLFGGAVCAISVVWILCASSRGSALASVVGIGVVLLRARRFRVLAAFAAAFALTLALLFTAGSPLLKLDRPSSNLRPRLWSAALSVAKDAPFFGQGPGQFDRGFLKHNFPAAPEEAPTRYGIVSKHAHSEPLQEAAETGFPGALLLLAALLTTMTAAWRRSDLLDPRAAACAALLAHACFDNLFALPALEWLFFAMLGSTASGPPRDAPRFPAAALPFAGAALAAFAWWPAWTVASARADGSEDALLRALATAPRDPDLWGELAFRRAQEGRPREALDALRAAESLHPTHALYPLMGAGIFQAGRRWNAALLLSERVLALEPRAAQAKLMRCEALLEMGRRGEAAEQLKRFYAETDRSGNFKAMREYPRFILGYDEDLLTRLEARLR